MEEYAVLLVNYIWDLSCFFSVLTWLPISGFSIINLSSTVFGIDISFVGFFEVLFSFPEWITTSFLVLSLGLLLFGSFFFSFFSETGWFINWTLSMFFFTVFWLSWCTVISSPISSNLFIQVWCVSLTVFCMVLSSRRSFVTVILFFIWFFSVSSSLSQIRFYLFFSAATILFIYFFMSIISCLRRSVLFFFSAARFRNEWFSFFLLFFWGYRGALF